MNWNRVLLGGVLAGVVNAFVSFLLHGFVMADTYTSRPEVFSQEQANPAFFFGIAIVVALVGATIFARTRSSWAAGAGGGIHFGVLVGLVVGFTNFYWPLVIADFPYYLAWCWLGIDAIAHGAAGAALGVVIRRT